jgi:hypothetical protein
MECERKARLNISSQKGGDANETHRIGITQNAEVESSGSPVFSGL